MIRLRSQQKNALALAATAALLAMIVELFPEPTFAQGKPCECTFAEPKYKAIGTKAGCTAHTHKGKLFCEIAFAGLGTDLNAVADLLGVDRGAYRRTVYDTSTAYLQYLRDDKRKELADPEFLSNALRIFMRGAYLREPLDPQTKGQLTALDSAIGEFISKYSVDISQVFQGSKPEFGGQFGTLKFYVGRSYVVVDYPTGQLLTVYMPVEQ